MSDTPEQDDPQTGKGAVWGAEFVDTGDAGVDNEPGDHSPPAQTGTSVDSE